LTKGEHVILKISLGVQAAPITIPSVKGLSLAAATSELEDKPYFLTVHTGFLQTVPVGVTNTNPNIVISQVPATGTKGRRATPSRSMCSRPTRSTSPSLVVIRPTRPPECWSIRFDARFDHRDGLLRQSRHWTRNEFKAAAGAFVNSGDQITLTTSTGYCKIQVPSVIGESQSQATNTLDVAHFQVSVTPTDPSTCSTGQVAPSRREPRHRHPRALQLRNHNLGL